MVKGKLIALTLAGLALLLVVDEGVRSKLQGSLKPDRNKIVSFSRDLARLHKDFSKLSFSDMPCEEVGQFLWYRAKICAEYILTTRNCEQPSATIRYVGPQSTFSRVLFPESEHYIHAATTVAITSPNGEVCEFRGE